jgi:hypothetical protein
MFFTRVPTVRVIYPAPDQRVDMYVDVSPDPFMPHLFAVEVKGARKMSQYIDATGKVKSGTLSSFTRATSDFQLPLAVFVCDVVAEMARIGWLLQPEIVDAGLVRNQAVSTQTVTVETIRAFADDVIAWYRRRIRIS